MMAGQCRHNATNFWDLLAITQRPAATQVGLPPRDSALALFRRISQLGRKLLKSTQRKKSTYGPMRTYKRVDADVQ